MYNLNLNILPHFYVIPHLPSSKLICLINGSMVKLIVTVCYISFYFVLLNTNEINFIFYFFILQNLSDQRQEAPAAVSASC